MLVLSRGRNESIVIGDGIEIVVVEIRPDRVRLAVKGPGVYHAHNGAIPAALGPSMSDTLSGRTGRPTRDMIG
ncbi:MAG: carbon storage regulator [Thermoguttaceae bacterium]